MRAPLRLLGVTLLSLLAASCGGKGKSSGPDRTTPDAPPRAGELRVDPAVQVGKLENGLTYYIRENHKPEERMQLWLVVNAGSILEDEDQRGLAHWVEHMAFNGTERFEKQAIVDYLETIGMRFGPDVNAFTSFDETVYQLEVPTDDPEAVEKAFDILQEWAGAIAFDPEEVEKERGVVLEEWRLGRGAQARILDKLLPIVFQGSHYADRLTIGTKESLEGADREALVRFYEDWYRPDLMSVIAVGDFDRGQIEELVRAHFSKLRGPEEPRERKSHPVPPHDETLVGVVRDKEMPISAVTILHKIPKRSAGTRSDYRRFVLEQIYHQLLNARFQELTEQSDPPFLGANSASQSFVRPIDVFAQVAVLKGDQVERGLEALLTEVERVKRHGFTATELARAKENVLTFYESSAREKDKQPSRAYADEIRRHHLQGEAMPGIERELALVEEFLPQITLDELNGAAREWAGEESSRVLLVTAPAKAEVPPEKELLALFEAVEGKDVEPWVDETRSEPILAEKPEAGKIVEREELSQIGAHRWTLQNGVEVILKPTDFKNDQILLRAQSPGGHSVVPDESYWSASWAATLVNRGGVGTFSAAELRKALAGKKVAVSPWIDELSEGLRGNASPGDAETMFQLVHLAFTAPREDEAAFASWKQAAIESVAHREADPGTAFYDERNRVLYRDHLRRRPADEEALETVSLDRAVDIYRDRFADAGDFTFVLVGSFELEEMEPLVRTYLGSLPSSGRKEKWKDVGIRFPKRPREFEVKKGVEPKSRVSIVFHGKTRWSVESAHDLEALAQGLRIRLREVLREEMSGTYSVGVSASTWRWPRPGYRFHIDFGCDPEAVEELTAAVFREIDAVKKKGLDEEYVAKVVEAQRRTRETALKQNGFWARELLTYAWHGLDPRLIPEEEKLFERTTPARMKQTARRYLRPGRLVKGVLWPEEKGAKEGTGEGGGKGDQKIVPSRLLESRRPSTTEAARLR